jgi:hypothetical protein
VVQAEFHGAISAAESSGVGVVRASTLKERNHPNEEHI